MQGTTLTGSWTIHHWLEEKSCRAADTLGKVVSSSGISFLISLRIYIYIFLCTYAPAHKHIPRIPVEISTTKLVGSWTATNCFFSVFFVGTQWVRAKGFCSENLFL